MIELKILPNEVETTCFGWYDGKTSAMFDVASRRPFCPTRLEKEVQECLASVSDRMRAKEEPKLTQVLDFARKWKKVEQARLRLEKAIAECREVGFSPEDIRAMVRSSSKIIDGKKVWVFRGDLP